MIHIVEHYNVMSASPFIFASFESIIFFFVKNESIYSNYVMAMLKCTAGYELYFTFYVECINNFLWFLYNISSFPFFPFLSLFWQSEHWIRCELCVFYCEPQRKLTFFNNQCARRNIESIVSLTITIIKANRHHHHGYCNTSAGNKFRIHSGK